MDNRAQAAILFAILLKLLSLEKKDDYDCNRHTQAVDRKKIKKWAKLMQTEPKPPKTKRSLCDPQKGRKFTLRKGYEPVPCTTS